jgi:hypothetical protein
MVMANDVRVAGLLALTGLTGCMADARSEAGEGADRADTSTVSAGLNGPSAQALAERARAAARSLYVSRTTATNAAARGLLDDPSFTDALDLAPGVVQAAEVTGPGEAARVRENVGVVLPIRGTHMVLLSTGIADYGLPGSIPPERGTDFVPPGAGGDDVTLSITVMVPDGANRLSFQYNFLSAEFPDFNTTDQFNDTFTLQLIDRSGTRDFPPLASVNSSTFFAVSDSRGKDTGFDIFTGETDGVDNDFPGGFPDAGLTDFRVFGAPVTPLEPLELRFRIRDTGDGILDSAVLIDALQFSALETLDPNTGDPENSLLDNDGSIVDSIDQIATGGTPVRGVVADGATKIVLRVKVPGPGTVEFSIPEDAESDNGRLSTLAGAEGTTQVSATVVPAGDQQYGLAVFQAPADFNRGGDGDLTERTVEITARYRDAAETGFDTTVSLQIRRPPVVLVRGLWSDGLDWDPDPTDPDSRNDLRFLVNNQTFATSRADEVYRCNPEVEVWAPTRPVSAAQLCNGQLPDTPRARCIPDPGTTVSHAARDALDNTRRLGIAATQVDVVAHGTGGLRVRKYLDLPNYQNRSNLGAGDINRLITINTPHFGSTMAAQIAAGRDTLNAAGSARYQCVKRAGRTPLEPGDLDSLARDAFSLAATPVRGHAFIGSGGAALNNQLGDKIVPKLLTMSSLFTGAANQLEVAGEIELADDLYIESFGACDHDLFSDVVSQRGGLRATATTPTAMTDEPRIDPDTNEEIPIERDDPDSSYFRSLRHPDINQGIMSLLNGRVESALFDSFPASTPAQHCDPETGEPADPAVPAPAGGRAHAPAHALATGTLRITSPVEGASVIAGDTLTVTVAAEGGFVPQTVLVFTPRSVARSTTPPFTTNVRVPLDASGPIALFAIGFDASRGFVISDSVLVNAVTTAALATVRIVTQDPILYGSGLGRQLLVVGDFEDRVRRNITAGAGTEYLTSNAAIVTVSPDGIITAVGPGIATVVARSHNRQDSITVTVKRNLRPQALAGADVSRVCVPPGGTVPVQLDASESTDPDSDPLSFVWFEDGVEIATGPTPTVAFAPGLHTIDLVVSDGISAPTLDTVEVSVAADQPPELMVTGNNPETSECGLVYSDDGATASDACDGDLTGAVQATVRVDTGTVGVHSVDYRVQDRAGQVATASRSVNIADRTPPEVTVRGANPETTECGLAYHDEGATAADLCDGDLTGEVVAVSRVDTGNPGSYAVDYQVTDDAGLVDAASRTVAVADRTPPRLSVIGANPETVECAATYRDDGATATDLCDGDLTSAVSTVSRVNTGVPGSYAVDYRVQDRVGLTATARRSVVVADRTPPDVSIAPMRVLFRPDNDYRMFELSDCAAAVDACGGRLRIDRVGEIVAIHSDEPDRTSHRDPGRDIVILGRSRFKLREQSRTFGNGRVYEIEFTVRDSRGNSTGRRSCFIGVDARFHDGPPVNDGRVFTVRRDR